MYTWEINCRDYYTQNIYAMCCRVGAGLVVMGIIGVSFSILKYKHFKVGK